MLLIDYLEDSRYNNIIIFKKLSQFAPIKLLIS